MKHIASLLAVVLALAVTSAWACPDDKVTDDGKQPTPKTPPTSVLPH